MATTEGRPGNIYRIPVHQKRVTSRGSYVSIPRTRSPSPHRIAYLSRRRHSTPPAAAVRFVDIKAPPANTAIKHYYPYTRPARRIREQGSISDSVKSTPCPMALVKRRYYDERAGYVPSTPTSLCSNNELILPLARKSQNIIEETPTHILSDIPSASNELPARKPWRKREQEMSFDFGSDIFMSDEDDCDNSLDDDINNRKSIRFLNWCRRLCPCRFSLCNICQRLYTYPIFCLTLCFLLVIGLLVGLFISVAISSEPNSSQDVNTTMNNAHQNSSFNGI